MQSLGAAGRRAQLLRHHSYVQVSLRERNHDARFSERLVDAHVKVVPNGKQLLGVTNEDAQLERKRAVPKAEKEDLGAGIP